MTPGNALQLSGIAYTGISSALTQARFSDNGEEQISVPVFAALPMSHNKGAAENWRKTDTENCGNRAGCVVS